MTEYERWHAMKLDDPDLTEELNAIEGNPEEINDRFYRELEFGYLYSTKGNSRTCQLSK